MGKTFAKQSRVIFEVSKRREKVNDLDPDFFITTSRRDDGKMAVMATWRGKTGNTCTGRASPDQRGDPVGIKPPIQLPTDEAAIESPEVKLKR